VNIFNRLVSGLGNTGVYVRIINTGGNYYNFISSLWDVSEGANNRFFLNEYADYSSTSLYAANVPIPLNGPYQVEVVLFSDFSIVQWFVSPADPAPQGEAEILAQEFVDELNNNIIILENNLISAINSMNLSVSNNLDLLLSSVYGLNNLSNTIFDYVYGNKILINKNTFFTALDSINMSYASDNDLYYSGGMSMRFDVKINAPTGCKLSYIHGSGMEVDLSKCNVLRFKIYSTATGGFFKIRLSENGSTWSEFVCDVIDDFSWVDTPIDISGMSSRSSVKFVDIEYIPGVAVIDSVQLLSVFPEWDVSSVGFWIDMIYGVVDPSGIHGDWA